MNETHDEGDVAAGEGAPGEGEPRRAVRSGDQDPKLWKGDGWTARVLKNEDDEGWAVAMTSDGESEPALVGPWTMGRDKKNPKPLDSSAFATLVKTANEILARHAQQRWALLHRSVSISIGQGARLRVDVDVVPDDDDPHAILTVRDDAGEVLRRARVPAEFRLTAESARRWVNEGPADQEGPVAE